MSGVGTEALVEESREVLRAHARSFRIAAWFLPSDVQDDAAVCYAFCRSVDDAVDGASTYIRIYTTSSRTTREVKTYRPHTHTPTPQTNQ